MDFLTTVIQKRYPGAPVPATEAEADRFFWHKAKETIAAQPSLFVRKAVKDMLRFWHVYDNWGRYMFCFALILPFSVAGMVLSLKQWRQSLILYLLLGTLLFTEVMFHATARFRVPFEPYFIMFASAAALRLLSKIGDWMMTAAAGAVFGANLFVYLHADTVRRFLRALAQLAGFEVISW